MSGTEALDSEYENGVADVLAFLASESATVVRNVYLPGRLSETDRQVDVVVRGRVYGKDNATLVADCKRWTKPIDVRDVGTFIDLVKDVEAEFGLLIATVGASKAALTRAHNEPGTNLDILPLAELVSWMPKGTDTTTYRVPLDKQVPVSRALRRAGFRVRPSTNWACNDDGIALDVFRHHGTVNPSGDIQLEAAASAKAAIKSGGVADPIHVAHGITMDGGTPGHRWLEVTLAGVPVALKILASSEAEAEAELARVAATCGLPAGAPLSYIKPPGWPVAGLFPRAFP